MIDLQFISPGGAPAASPLARERGIVDLSLLGKLEVRGVEINTLEIDAEVIQVAPRRALVVCADDRRDELMRSLPGLVVDVTAAYAGIEVVGEPLMRRLTDLDLDRVPTAAKVATAQTFVSRDGERFRLFFPRELAESVVAIVKDAQEGLT